MSKSQDIPNPAIAIARATATIKKEQAWILIHCPVDPKTEMHHSDLYGYLLNGLDDEAPHSDFLVAMLRNVADTIEAHAHGDAPEIETQDDPDSEWLDADDPPGEEPPSA